MPRLLLDAAGVDRVLHGGDDEPDAELRDAPVAVVDDLLEVVARVDVHDREGHLRGGERLLGDPQQHGGVLAAREQQDRALELRRDLADDEDRLGLQQAQVGQLAAHRVDAALGLGVAGPAAVAPRARLRAVRAADRGVALVVQRVVRHVVLDDVAPHVGLAPVGERVRLPQPVLGVPRQLGGGRARRRLVAPQTGDPRVHALERAVEGVDLADRAAGVGIALPQLVAVQRGLPRDARPLEDLDLDPVAVLDPLPGVVGLGEQDVRVEREDAGVRGDAQEEVEDDRRLLLERAGDGQPWVEPLHQVLEHAVGVELLQILRRDGGIGVRRHRPELSDKPCNSDSGSWFALAAPHGWNLHPNAPQVTISSRFLTEGEKETGCRT